MPATTPETRVAALLVRQNDLLLLVLNSKRGAFNFPMTKMREVLDEETNLPSMESLYTAAGRVAVEVLGPRPFPRTRLKLLCDFSKAAKSDVTGEIKQYHFYVCALDLPPDEQVVGASPFFWSNPDRIVENEPVASIASEILDQTAVKQWHAKGSRKRP